MRSEIPLQHRFHEQLRALGLDQGSPHLLVALSGGLDSVSLLFLLRFCARDLDIRITAAHLDHAMRPESAQDALWVRGLCAAWAVSLRTDRLSQAPRTEEAARDARHQFLRRAAREAGADFVVMAHHADDQAETVLFRALRGTGLSGLAGMEPRAGTLLRPLLPFWRSEIERFARRHALRWRTDASNHSLHPARNRLRREILPLVERNVAPGARRSLVSLAELARESEASLQRAAEGAEREVASREGGDLLLARGRLRLYDSAVAPRILRNVLRRFGVVLDRTGTRRALQFITDAPSGREMQLPGGVRVQLEFGVARVSRPAEESPEEPLVIGAPEPVSGGSVRVGGRRYSVEARLAPWAGALGGSPDDWSAAVPLRRLRFPLRIRGWQPGDRMRTSGGTKSLKKLFLEHRVPRSDRPRFPVLVDAAGSVVWVAGLPRPPIPAPQDGEEALFLTVLHD